MQISKPCRLTTLLFALVTGFLTACGGGGGGTTTPRIDSFTATPPTINAGEKSTLTWNLSGGAATTLSIDNNVGTITGTSVEVSPTVTTTYKLTASNAAGSVEKTVTVTVNPGPNTPPAPIIDSFTADPATIEAGGTSTLSWSLSGGAVTALSIDNGVGDVSGKSSVQVKPSTTTTYTLTAKNAAGSVTKAVMVTVGGDPTRLEPGAQRGGTLSDGQKVEYKFKGSDNTPLLFSVNSTDVSLYIEIIDFRGKTVLARGYTRNDQYPYTPPEDGDYTVRLTGNGGPGDYTVTNKYVAGPPEDRNKIRKIEPKSQQGGTLAEGAFDEFTFTGAFNTPLLFSLNSTDVSLYIEISDPKGEKVLARGYTRSDQYPFTPQNNGTYTVRVTGSGGPGQYTLTNEYVAGPPEDRNKVRAVVLNQQLEGVLAEGAFDDFSFTGSTNTPLMFSVNSTDVSLYIEIFDSNDVRVFARGYTRSDKYSFTPQTNDDYIVRLTGSGGPGSYSLFVEVQ